MISHYKAFGAKVKEEPAGGMGKGDRARRGRSFEGPERKKNAARLGGILRAWVKTQRLENWGARRAAFRPHFLRAPCGAAARGPPVDGICSGQVNCPCAKVLGGAQNACTARCAAPRCGAPKERKKKCRPVGRHFERLDKNSALGELGSATGSLQAALLARPVRRCRPGTPGGWNMLGASELPLRQGFGRGPKRLYGAVRRPALRGPEGAQEKMPPGWAAF
mgnify:CR=1 FL=1